MSTCSTQRAVPVMATRCQHAPTPATGHDPHGCENHCVLELQTVLIGALLLLTLVVGVYVALDRGPDRFLLGVIGVLEVALLALAVTGIVQVVGDAEIVSPAAFVLYLLAALVVLPLGVMWSWADRSRGSTAVLAVAAFTTAFLVLRSIQLHG